MQRCKRKFILYGYIIFSFFQNSNLWKNEVYFSFFLYAFIKQNYVFERKKFASKKLYSPTQRITV